MPKSICAREDPVNLLFPHRYTVGFCMNIFFFFFSHKKYSKLVILFVLGFSWERVKSICARETLNVLFLRN